MADCQWTTFYRGCDGGISYCGTILPAWVTLECSPGFSAETGICQKDPVPECPVCTQNPAVGNPIILSTGSKILDATDYATGDGEFEITRSYRSFQVGRSVSYQTPNRGLAGGWNFDFMPELQLGGFSGSSSSPNAKLALADPNGTANDFIMQSGGAWVPDTTTGAFYAQRNVRVEFVGTLPGDLGTLQSGPTQWRVKDPEDTVWTFQTFTRPGSTTPYSTGRPISRVSREGYRWDYAYRPDGSLQTVTDSFGRQATFTWNNYLMTTQATPAPGWEPWPETVASIVLPDGTSLKYDYDPAPATAPPSSPARRVIKVRRLNAAQAEINSTTYSYGDTRFPSHVTAITDFTGTVVAQYSYDSRGRGIATAHAQGADAYAVAPSETSTELVRNVTNPLGKIEAFRFQKFGGDARDVRLTAVDGQAGITTPAASRGITYDANGFIATKTDEEGRITSYTRDSRGRPTTINEAAGTPQARTTTLTWHPTFNRPSSVARTGLTVSYTFGATGQLATTTETDTTAHTVPYSTSGQARTSTYTWGAGGRLASINGSKPVDALGKDDTMSFAYNAAGNLLTSTNGLGQVTGFGSYDVNGRPGTMTDANGIVTAFTYDTLGRMKVMTVRHPTTASLDAMTSLDYDIHNRIIAMTPPATDQLLFDYDAAGRPLAVRTASGKRIDYQTDSSGNITGETVKRADTTIARQVTRTFDELGRLLTEALGTSRTTTFAYDKVDNTTLVTSPRNFATQAAFDPLNRLVSTIAPDTGTTASAYNAVDAVTSHTDAVSVQTTFVNNGFGEAIREVSPDRGNSTNYYDPAGAMTANIDGRGQRVDYTRDILGRLTKKMPVGKAAQAITYVYDTPGITGSYGVGRLRSLTDPSGTTLFSYDHRGNMLIKRQKVGTTAAADLSYAYDVADRIVQITYPSGRLVAYDRDSEGRVTGVRTKTSVSVATWTTLASSMTYEAFGPLKTAALGNGLSLANDWGNDGRLASKRLFETVAGTDRSLLNYGYDNGDNITAITDGVNAASNMIYDYDSVDRLTRSTAASGTVKRLDYLFDKNGNRTSVQQRTNAADANPLATDTYNRTAGTNRLASIVNASGTRTIGYDARGNTSSESRPGSISVSTTYDGYGRLLTYNRTGSEAQTNAYNGLDDRVTVSAKFGTTKANTRTYVYDPDGRLLGEYGVSAAAPLAETIWMQPEVANDNMFGGDDGTGGYAPLALVGGSGAAATLYWVHGSHLGVPLLTTNASGATATPTGYTAVGFPGQTRTLADLYYNRYRDYDTTTGRYIQADPIGLRGGDNLYLYANANPLRDGDPWGLATVVILGGPVGPSEGDSLGNPFGHMGIAFMDCGCVYSEGTGTKPGSSLVDYLQDQSKRRDSTIYILQTTPRQEQIIKKYMIDSMKKTLPGAFNGALKDNCATRVRSALLKARVRLPRLLSRTSPFPGDIARGIEDIADFKAIYPKQ